MIIIQTLINNISDRFENVPKTEISGVHDETSINSVEALQVIFGMEVTGIIDKIFWDYLTGLYEIAEEHNAKYAIRLKANATLYKHSEEFMASMETLCKRNMYDHHVICRRKTRKERRTGINPVLLLIIIIIIIIIIITYPCNCPLDRI